MALNATHNTKIVISAEDKTKSAFASAQKGVEGLVGSFAKFGTLAGISVFGAIAAGISKIATETANAQREQAQLAAVLRSTGEAAGWSREQLNKMADDLSKKSVFAAGDITNAQTRLLSYTGIVGKQFPKAMQATIDMATRMGMTVEQSAETIGRALDIPSQGLTALTRQGFRFTEAQKELVKEMEATGRTAEAQDIILKALESSYGGAAEAARNTMGGAMQALRNSMDDLFEASDTGGSIFVRIINDMALAVDGLSAAMRGVPFDFMDKLLPNYQRFRTQMDKEFGPPPGTWQPPVDSNMLPRGATIGGGGLTLTEQIQQRAAAFTENNKLTDAVAKQTEYAAKLAQINTLEREGGLTAELAARYRAQLHAQTFKVKKATDKWTEAEERHRVRIQGWIKQHEELYKARVATAEAMQAQLLRMDEAVAGTHEETEAVRQQIAVMQHGESAVIRMESARLMEAAAAAEQGLEYAKLNGLSTEHIAFTEAAIQKTRELSEARLQLATSRESKEAFELEKKRIEDLQKKQEEAIKEAEREVRSAAESMNQSITDALMRGFEDGLGFAENFKQTLMNMFKTLILRPAINFLVSPISNTIAAATAGMFSSNTALAGSGLMSGSSGGSLSMISQGKSLLDAVQNGFSGLNNSLTSSIGNLGTFLSTGNGGLGDILGGAIGQYSSQIASALPFAGAAFSLLTGNVKGAVSQGIGAGLGMAVGGPVGGLIGGVLGSVVGGLFGGGGEKYEKILTAARSTYDGGAFNRTIGYNERADSIQKPLAGMQEQFSRSLYSLLKSFGKESEIRTNVLVDLRRTSGDVVANFRYGFAGNRRGVTKNYEVEGNIGNALREFNREVLGPALANAIKDSDLPYAIRSLFTGFEATPRKINNLINSVIQLNGAAEGLEKRFGLTVNQAAQVSKATELSGTQLGNWIKRFAAVASSFNTIGEQLVSLRGGLEEVYGGELPASLKAYDESLKAINTTTKRGIKDFLELYSIRGDYEKYAAAIDGLKGNVRGAIFNMVSDQEKLAMQQEDMRRVFTELGYAVPGSIDELVALGKSIDYTTVEGLNLASVFPTLVQAFQTTQAATDALANSLNQLNPDRFRTFTDFMMATAFSRNGIPLSQLPAANLPSYDVGTSYVPKTGPALIHEGERILTASENRSFTQSSSQMVAELRALRREVAELRRATASAADGSQRAARQLEDMASGDVVLMTEAA